jgi:D-alanyl-D-alanine carboxypeptidase
MEAIRQILTETATPGVAVALFVDGEPRLEAAVGSRDLQGREPLDPEARFPIYSLTKTLLATAILQHIAAGRLSLDDSIQQWLPALPLETPVTIRQLLNHTGGLPDYGGLPAYKADLRANPHRPWSGQEFLDQTLPAGLRFAPGTGWAYSNIGYLLLKLLLETRTGQILATALNRQLFAPLDLQATSVAGSLEDTWAWTPGYSGFWRDDGRRDDIRGRYHPGWVSHGLVTSTAADMARLFDALFAGTLLPPDLLATMLKPVPVGATHPLFRHACYGLGLMLDPQSQYGLLAGHGGGGPGYAAGALCWPAAGGRRVVAVALANGDGGEVGLQVAAAVGSHHLTTHSR